MFTPLVDSDEVPDEEGEDDGEGPHEGADASLTDGVRFPVAHLHPLPRGVIVRVVFHPGNNAPDETD